MGHRHYFYEISKEELNRVKNCTSVKELFESFDPEYSDGYSIRDLSIKEAHGFGKLYYCKTVERISSKSTPLFSTNEDNSMLKSLLGEEEEIFISGRQAVEEAVQCYIDKISDNIELTLMPHEAIKLNARMTRNNKYVDSIYDTKTPEEKALEDVKDREHWVSHIFDPELLKDDRNGYKLTNSWLLEHSVFNLLSLLKHFDFENKVLLFFGW